MACTLNSTEPKPGDPLVVLLKKLVQALDETWECNDDEWHLVAKILTHFGGTPSPGDDIPKLWEKIRIALGNTGCFCGDWEWNSLVRILDQFLAATFVAGDAKYNLVLKFLEIVNNGGVDPVVLDPPVITQTDLNELSVAGTYFGAGGTQTILESSADGSTGWTVFANVVTSADPMVFDISGETDAFWRARTLVGSDLSPYSAVFEAYRSPSTFENFPNDSMESYTDGANLEGLNGGANGTNGFPINWASAYRILPFDVQGDEIDSDDLEDCNVWIKADQITGLSDGDPVSQWDDVSENGIFHFTNSGAARPTYNTNVQNGLPGVNLTSVSGVGMNGSFAQAGGQFSLMVVFRSNDLANLAGRRVVQGNTGNWLIGPYSSFPRIFNNGFIQAYYPVLTPQVFIITQDGTTSFTGYLNGVKFGQNTAGLVHPGLIDLGASGAFNEPADCRIFELSIFSGVLTGAQISGLTKRMISKWGI